LLGLPGGHARWIDELASKAGEVRTRARVAKLLLEDGRARGVVLESGEECRGSAVVLAVSAAEARALFDPAQWIAVPGDERFRFEACVARPELVVGFRLKTPLREPLLAFVGDPPAILVAASAVDPSTAPAGDGCLVGFVGLRADSDGAGAAEADALERAALRLLPDLRDSLDGREHHVRVADPAAPLAGGRERPGASIGGYDQLYLAGECTNAPFSGAERALASARAVAREIR